MQPLSEVQIQSERDEQALRRKLREKRIKRAKRRAEEKRALKKKVRIEKKILENIITCLFKSLSFHFVIMCVISFVIIPFVRDLLLLGVYCTDWLLD